MRNAFAIAVVLASSGLAIAEPTNTTAPPAPSGTVVPSFVPRRLLYIPGPEMPEIKPAALAGSTIFLNRCIGGCQMIPGDDSMTATPTPARPVPSATTIAEATDITADEWTGILQCVRQVYSPFDVKIVDVRPTDVAVYSGIIVGGNNQAKAGAALGLPPDVGGVGGGGCNPNPRGVAFSFADSDNVNAFATEVSGQINSQSRILGLCWIIAQETAHSLGLPNHEFAYEDDGSSACNDPMTYRFECGGQKFFRNRFAKCGEFNDGTNPHQCDCGGNQNSHLKLLNILGAGTSTIPPPTVVISTPAASSPAANSLPTAVIANAGSFRGVARVELYLNGYKWASAAGAPFGRAGQPNPSGYSLQVPAEVPNSIYDVEVKAYDDLEIVTTSTKLSLVKGPAGGCVSADACLEGQKCEAGKCFWDPPAGEVGDACTFPQACISGNCSDSTIQGAGICTQTCVVGLADACPMGLECISTGNSGICYTASNSGGCCSSSNTGTPWAPFVFGGVVLGFVVLRRRRR